jgi:hypothetical protein
MNQNIYLPAIAIVAFIHVATTLNSQLANMNDVVQNKYTVIRNGKEIGWLKTTSSQSGSERFLVTESSFTIQMLLSFEAKAITANKFAGDILLQAGVHRTLNGKVKLDNALLLNDGHYKIINGKPEEAPGRPIINTVTSIYFKEPVGITEIYSEVYLRYVPLSKTRPSVYTSSLPDGGSMTYSYTLGRLTLITAKTAYGTVLFKLDP